MRECNFEFVATTRKHARQQGVTYYFTGKPCKRGHFSLRRACNSLCIDCEKANWAIRKVKYKDRVDAAYARRREQWAQMKGEGDAEYQARLERNREYLRNKMQDVDFARTRREGKRAHAKSEKGKEYMRKYSREWHRRMRAEANPDYLAIVAHRQILHRVIRAFGTTKAQRAQEELGYTWQDLKSHLESCFAEGMGWHNRSAWHIDHRRPVSSFPRDTHVSVINALDNLQVLWAKDNLEKGSRY